MPVAPFAGALTVGVPGAWFTAGRSKPSTQVGPLVNVPLNVPTELAVDVPVPSFSPQRDKTAAAGELRILVRQNFGWGEGAIPDARLVDVPGKVTCAKAAGGINPG